MLNINQDEVMEERVFSDRFLLYMDILGTEQLTELEQQKVLMDVIKQFSARQNEEKIDFHVASDNIPVVDGMSPTISSFSDHILLSYTSSGVYPLGDSCANVVLMHLINYAAFIHQLALEKGMLMRGAITKGSLCHQKDCVLGKALNEAVKLEEKTAIYPRVILSNEVVISYKDKKNYISSSSVKRDFDGLYFINYLSDPYCMPIIEKKSAPFFLKVREFINKNMSLYISDIHKLAKWQWLANKFDEALDLYRQKFDYLGVELQDVSKFNLIS